MLLHGVDLRDEPLHALGEAVALPGVAGLDVPGPHAYLLEVEHGDDLLDLRGVDEVLLVREDEERRVLELRVREELAELDGRLLEALRVRRVDDVDEALRLVVVVAPVRADRLLPADVPACGARARRSFAARAKVARTRAARS